MSSKAALRLRDTLLTLHRPGLVMWDLTLTIPGEISPEEWDRAKRRLFARWDRAGFSAVWRIELQKRKQPHLHVVLWTPSTDQMPARHFLLIVNAWLECLPQVNRDHAGAERHAIHWKGPYSDIEQSPRWMAYIGAHASKRKREQLGWQGKQWGIVGKSAMCERSALLQVEVSEAEEVRIKRTLSRLHQSKIRQHRAALRAKGIKTRGRVRRIFWPRGCKLSRIMCPALVERIVRWAQSFPAVPQGAGAVEAALDLPRGFGPAGLTHRCLPPAGVMTNRDHAGAGGLFRPVQAQCRPPIANGLTRRT